MNSTIQENTLSLVDFLNDNKVPYVKMCIDTKTGKTNLRGIASGWNKWSYNKCMAYNKRCDPN